MRLRIPPGELLLGAVFVGTGAFWVAVAAGLPLWEGFAPATGFLPLAYGILLAVLGVAATLADAAPTDGNDDRREAPVGRPLLVLLALGAGVAGIESAGFFASMFLSMLFLFAVVERRPPMAATVVSAVVSLVLTLVFRTWLGVPFPAGPWGF